MHITSWYIIYVNFGGKWLAIIDAVNEAEALKILSQSVIVMLIDRVENMHTILTTEAKEQMISSFNAAKTTKP